LLRARDMYARTWLEPMTSLAYAAALTTKALLGPGVLLLPLRNPVILAKEIATLQSISNGRFIWGVGTGWFEKEFEAVGTKKTERGRRTDEVLEIVTRLLSGEILTYQGKFYRLNEVHIEPSPVKTPVWVGGGSQVAHKDSVEKPALNPGVARRIARSDGWFIRPTSEPHQITDDWLQLQPYFEEIERDPSELEIVHGQLMFLTEEDNHDKAVQLQYQAAEKILGTSRPRDLLEKSYLFGTIDEIVENVKARVSAVRVSHMIFHPFTDDPDQLELWGRELVPRLMEIEVQR
jgi:probable F420-dependent oxidoreductase